jgi:hypothetical protein
VLVHSDDQGGGYVPNSSSFSSPPPHHPPPKTRGVTHYGLAIYIKKVYIKAKKKNYRNSNISPCKNKIFFKKKNPLKETKILGR